MGACNDPVKESDRRRKLSEANKGKHLSDEHKRKIGDAGKGRHHSEETRRKISDAQKGEKGNRYGKPHSEETRRKMSDAHKGKTFSEETRRKISAGLMGKTLSEETRRKVSKNNGMKRPEVRRKLSEAQRGENGPNWKGGISFEPYCPKFNNEFKERVRSFFGRVCVECGTQENGKKLHVHHVNFNKMSCCDGTPPLFVPLCQSCHARTNHNREYWEEHFTNMINEYYGGCCYLPKEEIPGEKITA